MLRLTIDSTDDLDRVLEVVGSLFGVRVQVVSDTPADATAPAGATPVGAAKPARPAARRTAARRTASRRTTAQRGRRASSNSTNGKPSTAQVREWARETGLQVSDRGRIPAAVLEAYQEAH